MFEMDWNVRFDFLSFLVSSPILFFCCFGVFFASLSLSLRLSLCVSVSCLVCFVFISVRFFSFQLFSFLEILESFKISIDPEIWDLGSDLVSPLTGGWTAPSTISDHLTDFSDKKIKSCGDIFNVSMPIAADWRLLCAPSVTMVGRSGRCINR